MKLNLKEPPRYFKPRQDKSIVIADLGTINLASNEQLTFVTESGKNHDFAAKDWGFYATPSVNGRLKKEGFKTALVRNNLNQIYIMVVDTDKIGLFDKYCEDEAQEVLEWLDERPLRNE